MFDWQAEMSVPAPIPSVGRVATPHVPVASSVVSFAQALTGSTKAASNDNLPQPSIRGERVSIKITQDFYERGMNFCKSNLRGRLVLNKGDKPYSTKEIESKLQKLWKTGGAWHMLSLGRGYYEFFFANEMDMRLVWAARTVNLKPSVLRLFEWSKDFNMRTQRNTHAQVWIRWLELPQEYWMERMLREIASAVGTPLLIDNTTTKHLFDHYARILVDMDFSRKLFHEIVVEREGFDFTVQVAYEWLPDFCTHYQSIGHDVIVCRCLYPRKETTTAKEQIAKGKKHVPVKKVTWVPTKENPSGIGSSAAFGSTKANDSVPIKDGATEAIPQQNLDVSVPVQIETATLEKET